MDKIEQEKRKAVYNRQADLNFLNDPVKGEERRSKKRHSDRKSAAKGFIKNFATHSDLEELTDLIDQKKEQQATAESSSEEET